MSEAEPSISHKGSTLSLTESSSGSSLPLRPTEALAEAIVLVTTIDVGGGVSRDVELRRNDSPERVARAFVERHALSPTVVAPLAAHLQQHLDEALQEDDSAVQSACESAGCSASLADPARTAQVASDDQLQSPTFLPSHMRSAASCGADTIDSLCESMSPTNVFDRLYNQALEQQARAQDRRHDAENDELASVQAVAPNKASAALAAGRTRGDFANYGEYLYIEGLSELEKRRQRAERLHEEQTAAELAALSFRPQISDKAKQLKARQAAVPAWQRLSAARPRRRAAQLDAIHRENTRTAELAECTFKPKIDTASAQMMEPRMRVLQEHNISAHDQLFQDAVRRQARQEEYQSWYPDEATFRPALATQSRPAGSLRVSHSRPGGAGRVSGSCEHAPNQAHQRLYNSHHTREKKLEAARRRQMTDASGRPLFQPRTNARASQARSATAALPVGDYLYGRRLDHEAHLQQLARREGERERAEHPPPRVNKRSAAILSRLKARRFRQVFDFLDGRATGELDLLQAVLGGSPRFSNLSAEIRKDVEGAALLKCAAEGLCAVPPTPAVLQDMHERIALLVQAHAGGADGAVAEDDPLASPAPAQGATAAAAAHRSAVVDAEQFGRLMDEVVEQTRGVPRRYLLPDVHVRDEVEEPTFKPAVNGKSKSIAKDRWQDGGAPVYEQLHQHAHSVEARKQQQRRIRELEEISGCTFRPRLVSQQLARSGKALKLSQSMPVPAHRATGDEQNLFDCSGRPLGLCEARSQCPAQGAEGQKHALSSIADCDDAELTRQVEELESLLAAAQLDADLGAKPPTGGADASVRTSTFSVAASG